MFVLLVLFVGLAVHNAQSQGLAGLGLGSLRPAEPVFRSRCPLGGHYFPKTSACYVLSEDLKSQSSKEGQYCRDLAADPLILKSESETEFVAKYMSQTVRYNVGLKADKKGKWFWNDGTELDTGVVSWGIDEPKTDKGKCAHIVRFYSGDVRLESRSCNVSRLEEANICKMNGTDLTSDLKTKTCSTYTRPSYDTCATIFDDSDCRGELLNVPNSAMYLSIKESAIKSGASWNTSSSSVIVWPKCTLMTYEFPSNEDIILEGGFSIPSITYLGRLTNDNGFSANAGKGINTLACMCSHSMMRSFIDLHR